MEDDPPLPRTAAGAAAAVARRRPGAFAAPHPVSFALRTSPAPGPVRNSLVDDADLLIRALFDCGLTSAGVQSRHEVSAALSLELTSLIDVLDTAIRDIRRALYTVDVA